MNRFLLITTRTENFKEEGLPAHFQYLDELRAQNKVELAGGFSDRTGGAYIVLAESMEAAQHIADHDPLATSGSSTIVVKEWLAK